MKNTLEIKEFLISRDSGRGNLLIKGRVDKLTMWIHWLLGSEEARTG